MAIAANDGSLQVHKFLKDADALLGSIDNLFLDGVVGENLHAQSAAVPHLGSVHTMALRLQERLKILTEE